MERYEKVIPGDELNVRLWPRIRRWLCNTAKDEVRNLQGQPGQLVRSLDEKRILPVCPEEAERFIWFHSVARWDVWNRDSDQRPLPIDFWIMEGGGYHHTKRSIHIPEIDNLIEFETDARFCCDIKDVKGISASKSMDYDFSSIEEFAVTRCQSFIGAEDKSDFERNIKWGEIRLHNMSFRSFCWSKYSPFWMNNGGSHHFAAAHYLASRKDIEYRVFGKLLRAKVNKRAVYELISSWNMFLMDEVSILTAFMKSMRNYKCNFGVCDVPKGLLRCGSFTPDRTSMSSSVRVVLLSCADEKACKVSKALQSAGFASFNEYVSSSLS